jgi:hypothetical protein
MRTNLKT